MCEESGQVDTDKMKEDISSAFMDFDFDWKSAILTCEAVKFPMLCSLTERVQEDLDSELLNVNSPQSLFCNHVLLLLQ